MAMAAKEKPSQFFVLSKENPDTDANPKWYASTTAHKRLKRNACERMSHREKWPHGG